MQPYPIHPKKPLQVHSSCTPPPNFCSPFQRRHPFSSTATPSSSKSCKIQQKPPYNTPGALFAPPFPCPPLPNLPPQRAAILQSQQRVRQTDDARGILQGRRRKGQLQDQQRQKYASKEQRLGRRAAGVGNKRGEEKDIEYLKEEPGKGREVSVRLVRQRTDIGGISKAVVGRAVGQDCRAGRARRRHTEVRSSYHFRVRTKY
ncbi:hypothetical protein BY996DRAFT_6527694 [Phakopsora pachyrhizi]|nr:hypothetical protein BY996DRAFT_6527694 [Phakopsora pachyrhizi]